MPLYEYECNTCSQITEALQKFSDSPLKKCPHCSGKLRKLMSLNSFHLKGSGWYVTDYAGKKSGSQLEKSSGEDTAKDEKSDNSQKEAKSNKSKKSDSGTASSSD